MARPPLTSRFHLLSPTQFFLTYTQISPQEYHPQNFFNLHSTFFPTKILVAKLGQLPMAWPSHHSKRISNIHSNFFFNLQCISSPQNFTQIFFSTYKSISSPQKYFTSTPKIISRKIFHPKTFSTYTQSFQPTKIFVAKVGPMAQPSLQKNFQHTLNFFFQKYFPKIFQKYFSPPQKHFTP